jgi:retron-type reverse transcriptase
MIFFREGLNNRKSRVKAGRRAGTVKAEYQKGCPQRDSVEREGYGYRPKRSAQQAILKVKEYAEQGYTHAVEVDLSKYFDTLNHELLMNLLRRQIHDERVTNLIIADSLNIRNNYHEQTSY